MYILLFYLFFPTKCIVGDLHCEQNDYKGNCISCEDNYGILHDKDSPLNGWCVKCFDLFCNSCSKDASICKGCEENFTLDTKRDSSTYNKCVACPPNCYSCTLNNCTFCKKGFGFGPNHECIKCENPFCEYCSLDYKQCERCSRGHGNEFGQCYRCVIDNCAQCQDNIRDCRFCDNELVYDAKTRSCRKCQERFPNCHQCQLNKCEYCERGYYMEGSSCVPCPEECPLCQAGNGDCIECILNYVLVDGKCHKCTQYDPNCEYCYNDPESNEITCGNCKEGFILSHDNKCVQSTVENCYALDEDGTCGYCLSGYGPDANSHCSQCAEGCIDCREDNTKCSDWHCKNGYEYIWGDGKCSKCPDNCEECEGKPTCISCNSGYGVNENGLCSPCALQNCSICSKNYKTCNWCEVSLIYDPIKNVCSLNCSDSNCLSCIHENGTICSECATGFYLSDHQCIKCSDPNCIDCNSDDVCIECPDDYVIQNGKCAKCIAENCFKCLEGQSNACDVCNPGYAAPFFHCTQCKDANCAECINGIDNCRSCLPGFGLHMINGSSNYGKCLSCDVENCKKCDGLISVCVECKDNYYLVDNRCDANPPVIDEIIWPGDNNDEFPTWAIIVIVVVCVVVVGVVIFLIVYFCKKKKKSKVGADSSSV